MWHVYLVVALVMSLALMTSEGAPVVEPQLLVPSIDVAQDMDLAAQQMHAFDPLENIGIELEQGVLFEGDIHYEAYSTSPIEQRMSASADTESTSAPNSHQVRNSVESSDQIWPNKIVPYDLDYSLNETELHNIHTAMNTIMETACVEFVARSAETNFIYISARGRGCWSDIGMKGGNQTVSVSRASGCVTSGIVMHELMHALGFWHEHTRVDRDQYIDVLRENIMFNHQNDFDINHKGKILVPEYDYYSILHYKTTSFSKDSFRLKTIQLHRSDVNESLVGQRQFLSRYDKQRIQTLYGCFKSRRNPPHVTPERHPTSGASEIVNPTSAGESEHFPGTGLRDMGQDQRTPMSPQPTSSSTLMTSTSEGESDVRRTVSTPLEDIEMIHL